MCCGTQQCRFTAGPAHIAAALGASSCEPKLTGLACRTSCGRAQVKQGRKFDFLPMRDAIEEPEIVRFTQLRAKRCRFLLHAHTPVGATARCGTSSRNGRQPIVNALRTAPMCSARAHMHAFMYVPIAVCLSRCRCLPISPRWTARYRSTSARERLTFFMCVISAGVSSACAVLLHPG